jgi:hypothetical protein
MRCMAPLNIYLQQLKSLLERGCGGNSLAGSAQPTHPSLKDCGFNKTRNLILESAAEPHFPKLKIWF